MIRTAGRALVAPLRDHSNFPRLVFLLLGSALALAFAILDITVLVSIPLDRLWPPLAALIPLAVVGLPPVAVSLIPAVRVVEGSAVRSLVYRGLGIGGGVPRGVPDRPGGHVGNLLAKLTARDRTQAVIAAYESGFIRPGRD